MDKTADGRNWIVDEDHEIEMMVEHTECIWLEEGDLRSMLAAIEKAQGSTNKGAIANDV